MCGQRNRNAGARGNLEREGWSKAICGTVDIKRTGVSLRREVMHGD